MAYGHLELLLHGARLLLGLPHGPRDPQDVRLGLGDVHANLLEKENIRNRDESQRDHYLAHVVEAHDHLLELSL